MHVSCIRHYMYGHIQTYEVIWGRKGFKHAVVKAVAAPMRLSEVLADTTWESLQRSGAICCVPLGLVSTLMCNYIFGFWDQRKTWPLNDVSRSWGIIIAWSWVFLLCEYLSREGLAPALTLCKKIVKQQKLTASPIMYINVNETFNLYV